MDGLLRDYSFARAYIDDVIVFNDILEDHLKHLNDIFALFDKWQITLKTSKTYFEFFNISFLNQKVDSLKLTTAEKKLKTITNLFFFKIFSNLKTYFEMTKYLRDYVPYYAQKSESLNIKKTKLLKKNSMKKTVKKNFNRKTLMKNSSPNEIDAYDQLQANFSRSS